MTTLTSLKETLEWIKSRLKYGDIPKACRAAGGLSTAAYYHACAKAKQGDDFDKLSGVEQDVVLELKRMLRKREQERKSPVPSC